MKTVSATECKTHLGEYLEKVQKEPVTIHKTGRPVAVLISYEEYAQFVEMENAYWLARAKESEASGYLGTEKSMELLLEASKKLGLGVEKTISPALTAKQKKKAGLNAKA